MSEGVESRLIKKTISGLARHFDHELAHRFRDESDQTTTGGGPTMTGGEDLCKLTVC